MNLPQQQESLTETAASSQDQEGTKSLPPISNRNTLHLSNLDLSLDENRIKEFFQKHADVHQVRITRDNMGNSRGFGFITFKSPTDAEAIKKTWNYSKILEKEVKISYNKHPSEYNPNANLFISNLDTSITPKELEEKCYEYGNVLSCTIKKDKFGNHKGMAYVQFEEEKEARDCIAKMSGTQLGGKIVKVDKFVPRGKRSKPYRGDFGYGMGGGFNDANMMEMVKMMQMQMGNMGNFGNYGNMNNFNNFSNQVGMNQMANMGGMNSMSNMGMNNPFMMMANSGNSMNQFGGQMGQMNPNMMFFQNNNNNAGQNQNKFMRQNNRNMLQQHNQRGNHQVNPNQFMQQQQQNNTLLTQNLYPKTNQFPNNQNILQNIKPQQRSQGPKDLNWIKENLNQFQGMSVNEQKNLLGTLMYKKVEKLTNPSLTPKVTGMLIDWEVLSLNDIMEMLEDQVKLVEMVRDAVQIIENEARQE